MPKMLSEIAHITLHPCESGMATISVWFNDSRSNQERVTVSPYEIFDYRRFCARVLETTGHVFYSNEVEEAPDAWHAETRWRRIVAARLEAADVEPQSGHNWKPLVP